MLTKDRRLLLAGWDAADWKVINPLLDAGEMPNLARVVENGVMGKLGTLQPVLSPMLWTTIATGKRAPAHGILGFTEVDPTTGGIRPVSSGSRRGKAIWNILSESGLRVNVLNWFASHPAEPISGICVTDAFGRVTRPPDQPWPMLPGTVHPAEFAGELAAQRIHPAEIDGEAVELFVPRAREVDQEKDQRLSMVARLIAEASTVQAAATWVMRKQPWDVTAIYFPTIDHFSHGFMRYHAPRQDSVSQEDFDLYHDVVNSGYRLHDLMLGFLLELAGPETTVLLVSDHGFHSDHLRPRVTPQVPTGPADQHRNHGVLALMGPGIRRDERIYGASLLDVTPTVLALFGLPAGHDMPGRVLAEAFEIPPPLERIASWDGDGAAARPDAPGMNPEDARALIEEFVALGYIERPDANRTKAQESCLRENLWNLARAHLDAGNQEEALPLLEEIHAQLPERADFALTLAGVQGALGLYDEAEATAGTAIANYRATPAADWVLANILFERGDYVASLERLRAAEAAHPRLPALHDKIGAAYARLRQWDAAERAYRNALALDPDDAEAHLGLAMSHLRQRRFEPAAEAALEALSLEYARPWAHFVLGVALTRLGNRERAIQAFETAIRFAPRFYPAHAWLARIYSRRAGERYWHHFREAGEAARERVLRRDRVERRKREARQRAATRAARRAEPVAVPASVPAAPETAPEIASAPEAAPRGLDFVIVSGLPRSGTSLMMQMLHAAGMPVMTDGERKADESNPRGYFEWEPIRKLRQHPEILREAEGRAIKVISMLLPWLPGWHRYKIVFMDRPIDEVNASHARMLVALGQQPAADPGRMAQTLEAHRRATLDLLASRANTQVLVVNYPDLVRNPDAWATRIADFIGSGTDPMKLKSPIAPELHRHRAHT